MPDKFSVNRLMGLMGLPAEITVGRITSHAHCDKLFISFSKPKELSCPRCGSFHCVVKDSGRDRTVRHTPYGKMGTLLSFRHRRYLCRECGSSFYEPVYWLHPSVSVTLGLYHYILKDLNSSLSIHNIALNNGVTDAIVS